MTNKEIDFVLERFDKTEEKLKRRIVAETLIALEESVKLQSHYAGLLNDYDGGWRMQFKSALEWIERLREIDRL